MGITLVSQVTCEKVALHIVRGYTGITYLICPNEMGVARTTCVDSLLCDSCLSCFALPRGLIQAFGTLFLLNAFVLASAWLQEFRPLLLLAP